MAYQEAANCKLESFLRGVQLAAARALWAYAVEQGAVSHIHGGQSLRLSHQPAGVIPEEDCPACAIEKMLEPEGRAK
jgi:hypothetical protein